MWKYGYKILGLGALLIMAVFWVSKLRTSKNNAEMTKMSNEYVSVDEYKKNPEKYRRPQNAKKSEEASDKKLAKSKKSTSKNSRSLSGEASALPEKVITEKNDSNTNPVVQLQAGQPLSQEAVDMREEMDLCFYLPINGDTHKEALQNFYSDFQDIARHSTGITLAQTNLKTNYWIFPISKTRTEEQQAWTKDYCFIMGDKKKDDAYAFLSQDLSGQKFSYVPMDNESDHSESVKYETESTREPAAVEKQEVSQPVVYEASNDYVRPVAPAVEAQRETVELSAPEVVAEEVAASHDENYVSEIPDLAASKLSSKNRSPQSLSSSEIKSGFKSLFYIQPRLGFKSTQGDIGLTDNSTTHFVPELDLGFKPYWSDKLFSEFSISLIEDLFLNINEDMGARSYNNKTITQLGAAAKMGYRPLGWLETGLGLKWQQIVTWEDDASQPLSVDASKDNIVTANLEAMIPVIQNSSWLLGIEAGYGFGLIGTDSVKDFSEFETGLWYQTKKTDTYWWGFGLDYSNKSFKSQDYSKIGQSKFGLKVRVSFPKKSYSMN